MSLLIYHATRLQLNCKRYTIFVLPKGMLNTPETYQCIFVIDRVFLCIMQQVRSKINEELKRLFFQPKGTLNTPEKYQCTFNIDQGVNMSFLCTYHATILVYNS